MLNWVKYGHKTLHKALALTITLAALFLLDTPAFSEDFSAGLLYDRFPLTLGSGQRTEIMGPLYYNEQNNTRSTWAFPPFFSHEADPTIAQSEDDFLYPLFTYVKYGTQYRGQFFQLFSYAGGEDPQNVKHRITIFPLYFRQRSSDTNDDYTAYFPFYGHINNRLFRDKIYFVMFPAYGQTQKKDVVNYNYFYPFYNKRYGDGLYGWQLWPFYGREHKDVTTITNAWGVETVGGHDQYFVLWPFYFWQNNDFGTENPVKVRAVFPFYILYRSPLRDTTTYVWPFFTRIDDREKKYREREEPWPFLMFARGPGKFMNCIFPFYQHAYDGTYVDNFVLWPLYKYNAIHAPPLERHRTRIVFFLYQNTSDQSTETGRIRRRVDLWPFFVYHHDLDGSTRLQVLALIETFFPDNRGIIRNWSPLWSIWRAENNPATGASSQSFLWNLYRRDISPGTKKISAFFGLYQYQSDPKMEKVRLFYIPVHQESRSAE